MTDVEQARGIGAHRASDAERSAPGVERALRAVEALRVAEAQLSKRRQQDSGASQTTRDVVRLVVDAAARGEPITPSELARETQMTNSGMTSVLKKLVAARLVAFQPSKHDARSKVVMPGERTELEAIDPLTARIRHVIDDLGPEAASTLATALERIRREVDVESR